MRARDRRFSPSEVAPIVGVSESTVKRWVDAGHLRAEKTPGGHRKIALTDLLAFLRRRGSPLPTLEGLEALAASGAPSGTAEPGMPERLATVLLAGDLEVARTLTLRHFQSGRPVDEILDEVVAPAMGHVGERWAAGTAEVYEEHVATLLAWSILLEIRGLLPAAPASAPLALGAAPEGDPYILPATMAELVLTDLGWRTINIGPNTPVGSLIEALGRHGPRLVWLSVTSLEPAPRFFEGYPRLYGAARARGASVVLGGQGLTPELQNRLVASGFGTRLAHLKAFASALAG